MYIYICIYTYDNDAKRLDCDPTRNLLSLIFSSLLCLAPPLLYLRKTQSIHTRKTHTKSLYYIQVFTVVYN